MKKLFIVMLSVFALMLVGCSNPANSDPDPHLLGLDDCEVTLAAIEAGVPDGWMYDYTLISGDTVTPQGNPTGDTVKILIKSPSNNPDFKCYANADFSTIVAKYKNNGIDCYKQFIKK